MKRLLILFLLLCMVSGLTGCSQTKEEKVFDIRVLVWKYDDTYGSSVRQSMQKWKPFVEEELGVKIKLTMYDAADDMSRQVEQADMIVSAKPDLVIINLAENASGQALSDRFQKAGIPFLFYSKRPTDETYDSVVKNSGSFFVGTRPEEAGIMQGEILAELWKEDAAAIDRNGDGTVQYVTFEGEPNNNEAIARSQYSESTAAALGVPMESVVPDWIVANWDTATAQEKMLSTWSANSGIELVFCNNDDMGLGVIAALNQSGYNTGTADSKGVIPVIGVDATDAALEAIRMGKMTATVKQDGDQMGEAVIRLAMNKLVYGSWYEGYEDRWTLNEDGCSIFIPYAKITPETIDQ